MLRIRLTRRGKKNQPYFRIVVAESSRPIKGRFIEILGHLNPRSKKIKLNKKRIRHWLAVGAQPSVRVHNILIDQKIIIDKKRKATTITLRPSKDGRSADTVVSGQKVEKKEQDKKAKKE